MIDKSHEEIIAILKEAQMEVERILFQVGQSSSSEEVDYLRHEGNLLADKAFNLRTQKDLKINSLRSKANELIKRKEKYQADFKVFRTDSAVFLTQLQAETSKVENRGGARKGAGRKSLGIKKSVTITLPQEAWDEIDNLIKNGKIKSYPEHFRNLVNESKKKK